MHGSARLTVHARALLCERVAQQGWRVTEAAAAAGVSRQTASKWLTRFRSEGPPGLLDRSTRPHRVRRVPDRVEQRIRNARLHHRIGPHRLSWMLGIARSTIYAVLRRLGLNRLRRLEPRPAVLRYEWPNPGDMIHLDTKKLGRIRGIGHRFTPRGQNRNMGIGWNYVHVAVDDHSRLAYAEELPDELGSTAVGFTERALEFFARHGITVRRILTDNGIPYRSRVFAELLGREGITAKRTRPYTPRTNGKAEAMVKILINGWAYRKPYRSSAERARALQHFIEFYNHRRPHGGLNGARPIDRVGQ